MSDLEADYVVVGGGLTGYTDNPAAAGFLSGLSLLDSDLDYAYQSQPVPNTYGRPHTLNAGKCLGGGSVLNYGGWLHADAADYDEWADTVADSRWSYEGLKPWLRKAEEATHVVPIGAAEGGERQYWLRGPVKEAWTELGNSREGLRQPSHVVYPLDGVKVLTNATVKRIIFSRNTARGIEWNDGRKITARKEVIICAGTYRSPQLLQVHSSPHAVLLGSVLEITAQLTEHNIPIVHDSQYVGQNLHDHFAVYFAFRLRDPSQGYALGNAAWGQNPALSKGLPWDWLVSQPLPADLLAKHSLSATEQQKRRNLYEVLILYVPPGIPGIPIDGTHIATSTMLLLPTSRGTVSLPSGSVSASESPCISPDYFATQLDRDTLVHAARQTLKALLSTKSLGGIVESEAPPRGPGLEGLEPLTADASDEEIEERIRRTGTQHHHSGGTVAMGKVVDAEGRVLGVKGLRVADASIIPIPLGGHPQSTLYAMAEQIVRMIVGET
ncbi:hypothetical protein LA080_015743 [Diaporthe eres]|nr:hypothetical protein LA080_015743 [Diaporthe eres]